VAELVRSGNAAGFGGDGRVLVLSVAALAGAVPGPETPVPGVSATFTPQVPDPVPAGSSAALSVDFVASGDVGTLSVGIQFNEPPPYNGGFTLRLDATAITSELHDCAVTADFSVICQWDGEAVDSPQRLGVIVDVDPGAQAGNRQVNAVVGSPTIPPRQIASTSVTASPPHGTTSFAGHVLTTGGAPVPGACLFVASSPFFVFQTIADIAGAWSITGLPDNYQFVIGAVPPFSDDSGKCGSYFPRGLQHDLQPVFRPAVWMDLNSQGLVGDQGDPFQFAAAQGATVFTDSATGLNLCLTTAAPSTTPRPACTARTTLPPQLPATGTGLMMQSIAAAVMVLLGVIAHRQARSPRP